MSIQKICLQNFMVFNSIEINFSDGANVFIGENGTGKTHLLKVLYAFCKTGIEADEFRKNLEQCFSKGNLERLWNYNAQKYMADNYLELQRLNIMASRPIVIDIDSASGGLEFIYPIIEQGMPTDETSITHPTNAISVVFIPTAEMLSHSKGLVASSLKYNIPFDHTQMDILVNAQLWETKEITDRNKKLLSMLGKAIDGVVIYENDMFYVVKNNGLKIEYSFEAEGLKRLGLLWKVIRNGLLESGSILIWDEPDISIHPEHFSLISDVLYMLANDGVQIFVSTHDYNFAKYMEIRKESGVNLMFHSLTKSSKTIMVESSDSFGNLQSNDIISSLDNLMDEAITGVNPTVVK